MSRAGAKLVPVCQTDCCSPVLKEMSSATWKKYSTGPFVSVAALAVTEVLRG